MAAANRTRLLDDDVAFGWAAYRVHPDQRAWLTNRTRLTLTPNWRVIQRDDLQDCVQTNSPRGAGGHGRSGLTKCDGDARRREENAAQIRAP